MEFSKNVFPPLELIPILGNNISVNDYCRIDLSSSNPDLYSIEITNAENCELYVQRVLEKNKAYVAYGGYLEQRSLYDNSERFSKGAPRNIHLGVDFWCQEGTEVLVPLNGIVHSYANNADFGNYGPTIILTHEVNGFKFHSLYGHLSLDSLDELYQGKPFKQGEVLAYLGTPDCNVGYAPHLHFQLIVDMEGKEGDYPGVSSNNDIARYKTNCPNPNLLLGYP